jgi:hypothetical protein
MPAQVGACLQANRLLTDKPLHPIWLSASHQLTSRYNLYLSFNQDVSVYMQQALKKVLIIDDDSTAQKFISKAINDS